MKTDSEGNVTGDGADKNNYNIEYDPSTSTLCLKDATISTALKTETNNIITMTSIYSNGDLNLVLEGTNIVGGSLSTTQYNSAGIYIVGSLTIFNDGTLTASDGQANGSNGNSYGVYATNSVSVSGGTLKATGGAGRSSYGVYAKNVSVADNGTLEATGGEGRSSYGVYATNSVSVSGGSIIAKGQLKALYNAKSNILEKYDRIPLIFYGDEAPGEKWVGDYNDVSTILDKKYIEIQPAGFIITLDGNNGNLTGPNTIKTDENGMIVAMPEQPTRSGYDFIGWFTQPEGGEEVDENYEFFNDTTIYAQWSEKREGGSSTSGGDSSRDSSTSYTTGVTASGSIYGSIDVFVLTPSATGSANEVVDNETYNQLRQSVESGYTPIAAFEVKASHSGKLTLSFPVGEQYNGMQFVVKHKTSSGKIETYTGVVENGRVVITVNSLSPFMIAVKGVNKNPNTGR